MKENQRVNIRQSDIAKELNVSRVTVSKALRNHPDISSEMKKKVIAAARKLGYIPNLIATQLNSRKTNTIGIVIPDLENSFFSYIVDSVIDYATENDYRVIGYFTHSLLFPKGLIKLWKNPTQPFLLEVSMDIHTNVFPKMMFGSPITKMEPE